MATREPRYSREEFARRGEEIYDRVIRPSLRPEDEDKFVALDIESASYEMDRNDYAAVDRLLKRLPDAQIWLMRVGQKAAYRLGGRWQSYSGSAERLQGPSMPAMKSYSVYRCEPQPERSRRLRP